MVGGGRFIGGAPRAATGFAAAAGEAARRAAGSGRGGGRFATRTGGRLNSDGRRVAICRFVAHRCPPGSNGERN